MLGISPMVGIWGAPHAPKSDAAAIRGAEPSERRKLFGEPTPSPQYLRWHVFGRMPKPQGVYGERPMPPRQTLTLFGRMPEPQSERRRLFGEPTPSPQYLRWHIFGRCPSPKVFMGSAPYLQCQTLPLFGVTNPFKDAGYLGSQPQAPNISDGVYLGVAQAPGCLWGVPHAPKSRRSRYSECRTQREDASCLGSQPQAPNISDGMYLGVAQAPRCLWGVPHAPNVRRCRYSGSPNPTRDASYLGSQPQAPNISDGMYLGECPSPMVYMGSAPCPQCQTLPLFGRIPEPL